MLRMTCGVPGWTCLSLVLLVLAGCGNSAEQEQLDLAKSAVEKSLDAWKRGDQPQVLKSAADSIEFFDDDWNSGAKLADFRIVRQFIDTDGLAKCAAELTVQPPGDSPVSRTVTYQVVKKPHIVISRDPFN